jgi:hypothetical protein
MCVEPTTLAMAAAGIGTAAQTAMGISGSISQGYANSQAGMMRAHVAAENAKMALAESATKASRVDDRVNAAIGASRSNAGALGIDPNVGSPLLSQMFSAAQGNMDKQLIMAEGLNKAAGYHYAASDAARGADQALKAGYLGAGTALISGATSALKLAAFGSKWAPGSSGSVDLEYGDPLNYWSQGR